MCHGHGLPPCRAAGSLHLGYQLTPTPCAPTLLVSGEGTGLHHSAAVAAGRQTALHTRTHTHGTDTRPGTGASSSKQKLLNSLTAGEAERPRGAAARKPPLPCAIACTCHPVVSPLDMGRRRLVLACLVAQFFIRARGRWASKAVRHAGEQQCAWRSWHMCRVQVASMPKGACTDSGG